MMRENYALITGATKGIGRSIAYALAREGYHLMLVARTENDLQALTVALRSDFPTIEIDYTVTDCKDHEQVKRLAAITAERFPAIHILINNVGLFIPGGFLEEKEEALADHWAVNVHCTYYLSVYFGKKMCARGDGHIFNIGSIAGKIPFAKAASYSVTKYAVHGLTAVLRQEFGTYGVRVTEIIPGSTFTSSWAGTSIPEEKFVAADDIAAAIIQCLKMHTGTNVDEIIIRPLDLDV